ncbi:helix-turn-helix domain-containing protein [Streptomyces sp. O3]
MSIGNSPEEDRPSVERSADPAITADHSVDVEPLVEEETVAEEERPSVGRTLQRARIDAGLTVDEVSASTRVRTPIVHAIEQDDFSRCGGDVYARGHIRTLARAVGLDPAPLVAQYEDEHGGRPAPTPAAPLFEAERIRPERRRPNWTAAMVAAIVAVVGFVGFTLFSGEDDGPGAKDPVAGSSPSPKAQPSPTQTKPADPKPDPTESAIAGVSKDKVTVLVSAVDDRSWISAHDGSGRLMFDGILEKGDSKSFTAKEQIDLVLGKAGAVKLFVNGKEIKDEFEPGAVERLSYTKDDPRGDAGVG